MKLKTSVTLSREVIRSIERVSAKGESRSRAIERLVREGLAARVRRATNARDLTVLNAHADALNREAKDVLSYQADV